MLHTYFHYRRHQYLNGDENTVNRTLLKIGHTIQELEKRMSQDKKTNVPEPPLILRVYNINESARGKSKKQDLKKRLRKIEGQVHELVLMAHPYVRSSSVGKERFLTNVEFIDAIAALAQCKNSFQH